MLEIATSPFWAPRNDVLLPIWTPRNDVSGFDVVFFIFRVLGDELWDGAFHQLDHFWDFYADCEVFQFRHDFALSCSYSRTLATRMRSWLVGSVFSLLERTSS